MMRLRDSLLYIGAALLAGAMWLAVAGLVTVALVRILVAIL